MAVSIGCPTRTRDSKVYGRSTTGEKYKFDSTLKPVFHDHAF